MSRQVGTLLFAVCCLASVVNGQIGVTYCTCQPSVYTFTFNFSAECDIGTIDGPGVRGADCFARGIGLGSENTNLTVPVQVTSISILELDRSLRVAAQSPYLADFRDGDSFTYSSIVADPAAVANLAEDEIPGGIQLDMVGINALEQPITNVWIILFDNDCGTFPVLEIGDQIGWTILSDLRPPLDTLCPIARTESPTSTPVPPSHSPTRNPSKAPVPEPTNTPVTSTKVPVPEPTITPMTRQPMMVPTTAEPTACISHDVVSETEGNGGNSSSDSSNTKRYDENRDGKGTGSAQGDNSGSVKVQGTFNRGYGDETRHRYSKRHHFYYFGQQSVTTRGVGHGSRPVAVPSKRPSPQPMVECKDRNLYLEKIVKPPTDSRGPKLTKVSPGMARRPRPASDSHGPKLQKPSMEPLSSQISTNQGSTGKGPAKPTTIKLTSKPAEMKTRHPDTSKGKSYKSDDAKETSDEPSPSPSKPKDSGHSKIAEQNDTPSNVNEQPSPIPMTSGKRNKNSGSKTKGQAEPTPTPLVVPVSTSAITKGDAETAKSGDGVEFGVMDGGRSDDDDDDDDDDTKEEKEDVDSNFGNVNDDDLTTKEQLPDPPRPFPESVTSSPQLPTSGKGKRIPVSPAAVASGADDMDHAKKSKKGSDHHRVVQRTLRRLPLFD